MSPVIASIYSTGQVVLTNQQALNLMPAWISISIITRYRLVNSSSASLQLRATSRKLGHYKITLKTADGQIYWIKSRHLSKLSTSLKLIFFVTRVKEHGLSVTWKQTAADGTDFHRFYTIFALTYYKT